MVSSEQVAKVLVSRNLIIAGCWSHFKILTSTGNYKLLFFYKLHPEPPLPVPGFFYIDNQL